MCVISQLFLNKKDIITGLLMAQFTFSGLATATF